MQAFMSIVGIVGHVAFMFCPGGTRADRLRLYHGKVHEKMNRLRRQFPNRVHVLEMGSSPTSPKYNTCMRSPSVCRASIVGLTAVCFIAFAEVIVFAFADVIGPLG